MRKTPLLLVAVTMAMATMATACSGGGTGSAGGASDEYVDPCTLIGQELADRLLKGKSTADSKGKPADSEAAYMAGCTYTATVDGTKAMAGVTTWQRGAGSLESLRSAVKQDSKDVTGVGDEAWELDGGYMGGYQIYVRKGDMVFCPSVAHEVPDEAPGSVRHAKFAEDVELTKQLAKEIGNRI